jgi:hypothetical protein
LGKLRKQKLEVPNIAENHMEYCKGSGFKIELLRYDNAGEHQARPIDACKKIEETLVSKLGWKLYQ